MRFLQVTVLALQAVAAVEAAKVRWTLHHSCYKVKPDPENPVDNPADLADDTVLADAMIKAVNEAKAWASRAASKIVDSQDVVGALVGREKYGEAAKKIRDNFKEIKNMEGPIGGTADSSGRFDKSKAWIDLANSDEHWRDFVIVCRPELLIVANPKLDTNPYEMVKEVPFDVVRKIHLGVNLGVPHDLQELLDQEEAEEFGGDWNNLPNRRTKAITQRESKVDKDRKGNHVPVGGRKRIPETINFHPLWIEHQRSRGFGGWAEADFAEVTRLDALEDFRMRGQTRGVDIRPVDHLLSTSLTETMLHEFFHLSAFGQMLDAENAYYWANNVKHNNRRNPDLYAIIGATIELRFRDGDKYSVSDEGEVSPVA